MRLRLGTTSIIAVTGFLGLCGTADTGAAPLQSSDTLVTPYIPIERRNLDLPEGLQPLWPTFAAGGHDIVFQTASDAGIWLIRVDGTGLKCITCGVPGRPRLRNGGFAHAFPDGVRLLMTDGVAKAMDLPEGVNAYVLECSGSLRDCRSPTILPVDMSADRSAAATFQRRTFHMSPDGSHIGWMNVRSDGTVMVVARLERRADRYVAVDPRAVNPAGPTSDADDDADRWENMSQLYELKSFTPDGKAILAVGTPGNNVDVLRIELGDGRTTRLTAHPDWDEDSSLSPDQRLFVVNSWRGANRLSALSWLPQVRGFTGLMIGAAIAPYYVSTWEGFQCDLAPWLLPARGDDGGRFMGQPLNVFDDGRTTAASNVHGQRVWSPDSTMVLLNERTRVRGGASFNRIAIARLEREPSAPVRIVSTQVGEWAVPVRNYRGPHLADATAAVRGRAGGRATITYSGRLGGGGAATKVVFDRFTDDGVTFVEGTMSGAAAKLGDGERRAWTLLADVRVTGRHRGVFRMNLTIDNGARPLPKMSGTLHAVYDGKSAPPLPALGPCYASQPHASPLRLKLVPVEGGVRAEVAAAIHDQVRPVMNAVVRAGALTVRTDMAGRALLPGSTGQNTDVVVTAGSTFITARSRLKRSMKRATAAPPV